MTSLKNTSKHPQHPLFEIIALLSILALASYLRLVNVANTPGWYTDEGTHLDIAQHLMRGQIQYLAIGQSTLLVGKLPLFDAILTGLLHITGGGMGTLRTLTGVLGVISVGLLYWVVRRTQDNQDAYLPLLSALMLAIYPQAVLYSRFGFSYNLLAPLVLLTVLGLWGYLGAPEASVARRGWLALAALAIGIGTVSDLWMFCMVIPMALVVSIRRWRDLAWSLPLLLLPFGLYVAVMLAQIPQVFIFDLHYTLSRLSQLSPAAQLTTLGVNYTTLIAQDTWIALALVGLLMLRPARLQRLSLLLFLFPIAVLGRTVALYSLSFYYMIPLLPFVGLGMASVIRLGVPYAWQVIRSGLLAAFKAWGITKDDRHHKFISIVARLILFLLAATPFLTSSILTANLVRDGFHTQIDPFLLDPASARQAAQFVNARTGPGDLVIASPGLAWLLSASAADFQMSIAFTGQETPHLPANLPADRFAFDPRYTQARFVIVDNLWRN
jgi:Dolichyl-phosphate-mannose-protein mannosyltransferase